MAEEHNRRPANGKQQGKPAAGQTAAGQAKTKKRKKKSAAGKRVLIGLMLVLIAVSTVFIVYVGKYIYATYQQWKPAANTEDFPLTSYDTTPASDRDKVGYYLLGLMGKESHDDTLEMLSLVCLDKKAKKASILQIPQATYLGEGGSFAVAAAGDVWANPKPYDWCDTCGKRLYEPDISDGKHTACGTAVTQKTGSSTVNLVEVFNEQYSMPVDGYFLFEQESFVKLIDLTGGVDVKLDAAMQVDDVSYKAGVQTLDGKAALQYVTTYKAGIDGDIGRMGRLQQVFVSLFQRLFKATEKELTDSLIGPLMNGSTPIRVTAETKTEDIVSLIQEAGKVSFESMTAYVIPGVSASAGGKTYYSVRKAELLSLLTEAFNPYGRAIAEGDLGITELKGSGSPDTRKRVLSDWVVDQAGQVTTTTAANSSK